MKFYKIVSYLGVFSFILLGLLTIGSIIYSTTGWVINLIMGLFFTTIGYYLYAKAKSVIKLIFNINKMNNERHVTLKSIDRFMFFEKIFIICCLLFGALLLSLAFSRIFGENLPIFG